MLSTPSLIPVFRSDSTQASLQFQVLTAWDISPSLIPELEKYYLLHWQGSYLSRQWAASRGLINHQGIDYIPSYLRAPKDLFSLPQVALSFRKLPYLPMGTVLISSIPPRKNQS